MCETVRHHITEAVGLYEEKPREQWIFDYPAQVALTGSQIWWTTDVGIAFSRLEEGYETALKDYNKKQIAQLNALICLLLGDLTSSDRQKIMTICTIDVHARDVVAKLVAQKITSSQAFAWLSQLRHRWEGVQKHCFANICDAQFQYCYEYLGNTPRLVITPLTDSMPRRGDGYLSKSESDAAIGQLSRDDSGAGMTRGLAVTTGNDPKLSGEKVAKRRRHTEDAAGEDLCLHAADGGHLGATVLARISKWSPSPCLLAAMESQPLLANLQMGDMSIFPTLHVSPTEDARRLQMGNVLSLFRNSNSQDLY
ncbi:UNVERIFIED_CONTAM: hypothetical protein K2H54_038449 [Gekko kuhli]